MRNIILLLIFCWTSELLAQPTSGQIAYYSFDNCAEQIMTGTVIDDSGNASNGTIVGNPTCACGVIGDAMSFDGLQDLVFFTGTVSNNFNRSNLTISFYMKPANSAGVQGVMRKAEDCDDDHTFNIQYSPSSNFLTTRLSENSSKTAVVADQLDFGRCWQHVTIVRQGNKVLLYINGDLKKEAVSSSRIDLTNNSVLILGESACTGTTDNYYRGEIDEMYVYNRALDRKEIEELFLAPDRIATGNTTVFLGNSVDIEISNTCATDFSWSPATNISDPFIGEPTISPTETTTYTLTFSDGAIVCTDSVRITVIDPDDLDCTQVYLPTAFTPNGDNLNDDFGISNPYAVQNLLSFEIFDRWGSRVFFTDDPFDRWDGNFKSQELNPGVLLYRVRFLCNGEENIKVGSLSILR